MYIKFDNREKGKRFTFFSKEREIGGQKVTHTDKCVFGTLSEGIKTGENNGQAIWENDYWNVTFCGKAFEKAMSLKDKDRVSVVEMNIRNVYSKNTKKSYPQITVTDFDVMSNNQMQGGTDGFMNIPDNIDEELPFN